jgi:hypothetical protein
VKKGDQVRLSVSLCLRDAFRVKGSGSGHIDLDAGRTFVAATDELGGNIFIQTTDLDGHDVVVPVAEGEWELDHAR